MNLSFPKIVSPASIALFLIIVVPPARSPVLSAQQTPDFHINRLTFQNNTSGKSLSQNSIYSILEDREGYLWFGTWDGLNKYDGYGFTVYTGDQTGGQTIQALLEDDTGMLWIGTDDGLTMFDRKKGIMRTFRHNAQDPASLVHDNVTGLLQDKEGRIWIGTRQGLCCYDRSSGSFTGFLNLPQENTPLRSNAIQDMKYDGNSLLWLGTRMGLIRFDIRTYAITRYYHLPGDPATIPHNMVRSILIGDPGFLWVGTREGLCLIDMHRDTLFQFSCDPDNPESLSDNRISSLLTDESGVLWVGTDNGLNRWNPSTSTFTRFFNQPFNSRTLSNNRILSLYEDSKGTLWIGTFNGINKIDRHANKFRHYRQNSDDPNSLNSNYVISIMEDRSKKVWIATDNGLNILDRKSGRFTVMQHQNGNPNSLSSNSLRVVYPDRTGAIWIGTQNNGIDRYDPVKKTFTHFLSDPDDTNSLSSNDILCIMEDSRGYLWAGTNDGGLNRLEPGQKKWTVFRMESGDNKCLSNNQVWTIYEDHQGDLWIGTGNGLNRYDVEQETFEHFLHDPSDTTTLGALQVFSVFEDSQGTLWIGTKGGGLNSFDKQSGKFKRYPFCHGLPSRVVYGCLEDDEGNLWIATNWGLSKYDRKNNTFINFDVNDGVQSNEFNIGALWKNPDGELYFGGMNGFNVFHPSDIQLNPLPPKTVITSFAVFDKLLPAELHDGDTVRLSARENFFTITFSALDYTNPFKNRYRYRLDNYDNIWTTVTADNRQASYTKVKPGNYLFTVMGSNNNGIWDEKGASITIIIKPLWFQSWFFRIPFTLLIIAGIWFFVTRRIKMMHRKHEVEKRMLDIEKQLYDTELQALRLQMNPHFIFNTLNSIQSYILENETDRAVDYLGKFSQLMRSILINSRESSIPVQDELKALRYYMDLEKLRFNDKFDYTIEIDPEVDEEFMEIPTMIIQPYIENAIIHGLVHKTGKGFIRVKVCLEGDHILWIIEDNGIGRRRAMEIQKESGLHHESRGMLITRERLDVLNKMNQENFSVRVIDLTDNEGKASGTRVEVRISGKEGE